jgi:hypothetical protein
MTLTVVTPAHTIMPTPVAAQLVIPRPANYPPRLAGYKWAARPCHCRSTELHGDGLLHRAPTPANPSNGNAWASFHSLTHLVVGDPESWSHFCFPPFQWTVTPQCHRHQFTIFGELGTPLFSLRSYVVSCTSLTTPSSVPVTKGTPPSVVVHHPQAPHHRQPQQDCIHPYSHYVKLQDNTEKLLGQVA